ncbi:ribosomal protein L7/L12 [Brevibacillus laterosporus]|uniref:ribosomal protein L7/L12 n=1 Tax=Brevibacillus laterosporus TaxID=1465 RepID=UPI003D232707
MEFGLIMALLGIVFLLLEKVSSLQKQLKKMDVILQQIATQVGVPDYSDITKSSSIGVQNHPINTKLSRLLSEGKKIEAIKEVRKELGLSLKEAKDYVERL